MTVETIRAKVAEVQNLLDSNGIFADVYSAPGTIQVEISWGDWKHEHLRADWLIANNIGGLLFRDEKVTEEDGSDCYSAVHSYLVVGE